MRKIEILLSFGCPHGQNYCAHFGGPFSFLLFVCFISSPKRFWRRSCRSTGKALAMDHRSHESEFLTKHLWTTLTNMGPRSTDILHEMIVLVISESSPPTESMPGRHQQSTCLDGWVGTSSACLRQSVLQSTEDWARIGLPDYSTDVVPAWLQLAHKSSHAWPCRERGIHISPFLPKGHLDRALVGSVHLASVSSVSRSERR